MKKLRVGVLMGGKSLEREVSFNSGRTVCDHLDTYLYEIKPLFQNNTGELYILPWKFLHRGKITDFQHRLNEEAEKISWDELKKIIDFMYIAVHGRYAEDGTLQGMLEILKIPYLGSKVYSSALSMNKAMQKEILKSHNIDVPRGITIQPHELKTISAVSILKKLKLENIELPVIIRPEAEGSSLGIKAIFEKNKLINAIKEAANIHPYKTQTVLVEEKLEGMEFCSVIITDPKTKELVPLPISEITPEEGSHIFDYEQKYMPGRSIQYTPARCNKKNTDAIINACKKTMQALGITNLIRTDGFLTNDGRIVIIDPNTLTGMGPATFLWRQAAHKNMSHTSLINHLIKTEISSYNLLPKQSNTLKEVKMNKTPPKLRVAVLLGGRSREKEISLESGRNIFYKLSPEKYIATPIFVDSNLNLHHINQKLLVCHSTQEIESYLKPEMQIQWSSLPNLFDFVFLGLHGGEGEDGSIQGALEMLGLPYNGSGVLTSALCIDKHKTNNFLLQKNFNVPKNLLVSKDEFFKNQQDTLKKINDSFNYPIIIKPHNDGCSVSVQKINTEKDVLSSLEIFFNSGNFKALIEEFIKGMELTVGVMGNNNPLALPPSQTVSHQDVLSIEEKFLPGGGENQTPAPLKEESLHFVQTVIKNVYVALGCKGYSRIDCFYQNEKQSPTGKERVVIIEANTLPGMTPATCLFHQGAEIGIKPMELIDKIIELGLEEHKKASNIKEKNRNKSTIKNKSKGSFIYD